MAKSKQKQRKELIDKADEIFREIISLNVQTVTRQEEGKTISVDKLPDCKYKELLMSIVQDPSTSKVCIVAWLHPVWDTWTAFIGYPDVRDLKIEINAKEVGKRIMGIGYFDLEWLCENIRSAEDVRMLGEKLPKDIALILFPDWKDKEYKE